MTTRLLVEGARSLSTSVISTAFDVDLGRLHYFRAICLLSHNLTTKAKVRIQVSKLSDFSATDFDSLWIDAYAAVRIPMQQRKWRDRNFWTGMPSDDDLQGYSLNTVVLSDQPLRSRYIRVQIDDTTNPVGYVEIARLMVAPMVQNKINMNYGASTKWVSRSTVTETDVGVEFFDKRKARREFSFSFQHLSEDEGMILFDMDRILDITGEVFFMYNPDDKKNGFRRSFLGRMTQLTGLEAIRHNGFGKKYTIRELK